MLDILFINPPSGKEIYQNLTFDISAKEPPVWAGLLANYAKCKGKNIDILDGCISGLSIKEIAVKVIESKPALAVVVVYGQNPSASTPLMSSVISICKEIKNISQDTKIAIVGGHVAALPKDSLLETGADFACTGEGAISIVDLVDAIKNSQDYSKVNGIVYTGIDNTIFRTHPSPYVVDLDNEMPGVCWDLINPANYKAHNWHCFDDLSNRSPYASLYTTLGCPFNCNFCCIQAPFRDGEKILGCKQNSYRLWSSSTVIKQIDYLVQNHNVRNFKFADEIFLMNKQHVNEICDALIDRQYDLNIWAYARLDMLNESLLEKMRKSGFRWLGIGVESANLKVRQDTRKNITQSNIIDGIQKIKNMDIYIGANFIFGLPEDNNETMQETLNLALSINAEYSNFNVAMAFPGSELYNIAKSNNWKLPDKWTGYSQYSSCCQPLSTNYLNGQDVLKFRDYAWKQYFNNPSYISMILNKFGTKTADHIKYMVSINLQRY